MPSTGEQIQFKHNPIKLASDFKLNYDKQFPKDNFKTPEDVKLANELFSNDEMPSSIALRQLRQFREHDGADPGLTIFIADILEDNTVVKPQSWINREVVRTVLRMAITYDIADFKVEAIDNARGKELEIDPRQTIVEELLKKLEEQESPLPIESRG